MTAHITTLTNGAKCIPVFNNERAKYIRIDAESILNIEAKIGTSLRYSLVKYNFSKLLSYQH